MDAKLLKTKAGKGVKIVVNGQWFYTSMREFDAWTAGKTPSVQFRDNANFTQAAAAKAAPTLDPISEYIAEDEWDHDEEEKRWAAKPQPSYDW